VRALALAAALLAGCAPAAPEGPKPLRVAALSFPVDWLARHLRAPLDEVRCALPPGADPGEWQPPGGLVAEIAGHDLIVQNGAGYEAWVGTAALPASRMVDTSAGLQLLHGEALTHSHGPGGAHAHGAVDPHTWMDPLRFLQQAEALAAAWTAARPDDHAHHEAGLAGLRAKLTALDARWAAAAAPLKGQPLAANHPAFGYLADRYGLQIEPFAFDPQDPPSPEALAAFQRWAQGAGPSPVLLWEAPPSDAARAGFPAGIRHVHLDPLEQPGPDQVYDYLQQAGIAADTLAGVGAQAPATPPPG
jgi:zinc transport system substrate-binding protein